MSLIVKAPAKQIRHELPRVSERESMTGPDVIKGLVRDAGDFTCTLWDDPMQRAHYYGTPVICTVIKLAYAAEQPLTVTTEKLKGKWTITKCEEA